MERWPDIKRNLRVGQTISGCVIARAPFGVWIDLDRSWPALLLLVNMENASNQPIGFDEYPQIGTQVQGRINALGDRGEIGITQLNPDDMIEADNNDSNFKPKPNAR